MFLFSLIFLLGFIFFLIWGLINVLKKDKSLRIFFLSLVSFLLFLVTMIHYEFSVLLFILIILLIVMLVIYIKSGMNHKDNKRFIIVFWVVFILTFIIAFTTGNDTKDKDSINTKDNTITKKDINKMSEEKRTDYIFDVEGDKGDKLYKKDKETYKYLFKKVFDKSYDSVETPSSVDIDNMNDKQIEDLPSEVSTKLSHENEKVYSKYLDRSEAISSKEAKEDDNKDGSENTSEDQDTEKLKQSVKDEISNGKISDVQYYNDSLGSNAVIVIKGKENLTDKLTADSMRTTVAEAVKGVKKSNLKLDNFKIDITYPVEDDNGNVNKNFHVIKSEWDMNTVKNLNKNQLELLNTELSKYADSYQEKVKLK